MMKLGKNYVFGVVPDLKLVLPPGTLRYKLKERPGEFARIFLKDKNGVTEHYVVIRNGELHPGVVRASNISEHK